MLSGSASLSFVMDRPEVLDATMACGATKGGLISSIMDNVLNLWGFLPTKEISSIYKNIFKNQLLEYGATEGVIKSLYGETKVLCIREANLDIRKKLIIDFLHE